MPRPLKLLQPAEQLVILNRLFNQADSPDLIMERRRVKEYKQHLLAAIRVLQEEQKR